MDKENTGYQVIINYFGKQHISRKYAEECDCNSTPPKLCLSREEPFEAWNDVRCYNVDFYYRLF